MCNGHLKDTLINSRIGEQLTNLLKIEKNQFVFKFVYQNVDQKTNF
jgi:hypothetical protein